MLCCVLGLYKSLKISFYNRSQEESRSVACPPCFMRVYSRGTFGWCVICIVYIVYSIIHCAKCILWHLYTVQSVLYVIHCAKCVFLWHERIVRIPMPPPCLLSVDMRPLTLYPPASHPTKHPSVLSSLLVISFSFTNISHIFLCTCICVDIVLVPWYLS